MSADAFSWSTTIARFVTLIGTLLEDAGHVVVQAADGPEALALARHGERVRRDAARHRPAGHERPRRARARRAPSRAPPRVVIMTADDTPETLLEAGRGQADRYVRKPFAPSAIVEVVDDAIAAPPAAALPIEVVSARPEWVELVAPCSLGRRSHPGVRDAARDRLCRRPSANRSAQAFRELLSNAIEWGGKLDPTRKVRISCLRAQADAALSHRRPGRGLRHRGAAHAAISNPEDDPLQHAFVREEKGLRPGGLGLAITRTLVDELIYNEARNEVVFVKYLD